MVHSVHHDLRSPPGISVHTGDEPPSAPHGGPRSMPRAPAGSVVRRGR